MLLLLVFTAAHAQDQELALDPPSKRKPRRASVAKAVPNGLSIELAGRGGAYSFNYDRAFGNRALLGVGLSYLSLTAVGNTAQLTTIPVYANYYVYNSGIHRPFLTGGVTILHLSVKSEGLEFGASGSLNAQGNSDSELGSGGGDVNYGMKGFVDVGELGGGTIPVPVMGVGHEIRSRGGYLLRAAGYVLYVPVLNRVQPWAGLTLGTCF